MRAGEVVRRRWTAGRLSLSLALLTGFLAMLVAGAPADAATGPGPFVQVAAGARHTCALTGTGDVWCWGDNDRGQLGRDDDGTDRPGLVTSLPDVAVVDAGGAHTCAVTTTGDVWCWGANGSGQLGDGTTQDRYAPVRSLASGVSSVSTGRSHTCAVARGGTNEVQQVGVEASNGTFTLSYEDAGANPPVARVTTDPLPWDVPAPQLDAALDALTPRWNVSVWRSGPTSPYSIAFDSGPSVRTDLQTLQIDGSQLRGSVVRAQVGVVTDGGERLLCWGSDAAGQLGRGDITDASLTLGNLDDSYGADERGANSVAVDPGTGDFYLADTRESRIWRFSGSGRFRGLYPDLGFRPGALGTADTGDGLHLYVSDPRTALVVTNNPSQGGVWRYAVGETGIADRWGWSPTRADIGLPNGYECDCVVSAMTVDPDTGAVFAVLTGQAGISGGATDPLLKLVRITPDLLSTTRVVDVGATFPAVEELTDLVIGQDANGAPVLYALQQPTPGGTWKVGVWDIGNGKLALRATFPVDPRQRGATDPAAAGSCPTQVVGAPEKTGGLWKRTIGTADYDFGRLGQGFDGDVTVTTTWWITQEQTQKFIRYTDNPDDGDATEDADPATDGDGFWVDDGAATPTNALPTAACLNEFAAGSQSGYGRFVGDYRGDPADGTALGATPSDAAATADGRLLVVDARDDDPHVQQFDSGGDARRQWPGQQYTPYPTAGSAAYAVLQQYGAQVTGVSAGDDHTCLSSRVSNAQPRGPVLCWGSTSAGQAGYLAFDPADPSQPYTRLWLPIKVPELNGDRTSFPVAPVDPVDKNAPMTGGLVAAGGQHTCTDSSTPWEEPGNPLATTAGCWGSNSSGQLLVGSTDKPEGTVIPTSGGHRLLDAGGSTTCRVATGSDDVVCDGPATTDVPAGVTGATSLSVGARHACAVVDGHVVCWGSNDFGQTGPDGSGNALPATVPVVPGVHATGPADLSAPIDVVFDDAVEGVSPGVLVVRDQGAAVVDVRMSCLDVTGSATSCDGVVRTARLRPTAGVVAGETYFVQVNPTGALEAGGIAVPPTTVTADGPTELGEDGLGDAAYAWATLRDDRALGGRLVRERTAGASVSYDFSGPRLTWYTVRGRSQGLATVRVDGAKLATVDNSARRSAFRVARTFRGLGGGDHTVTVTALGSRGLHGRGAIVSVDGFASTSGRAKNPALDTAWGSGSLASTTPGGAPTTYRASEMTGSSVSFRFRATSQVDWQTLAGSTQGRAEVYVDGDLVLRVDNHEVFDSAPAVRASSLAVPASAGTVHRLRIVVVGSGAGPRQLVSIDGFRTS